MLKESTPNERLSEALKHFGKIEPIAYFASIAATMVLYDLRYGTIPDFGIRFFLFLFGTNMLSGLLAILIWLPLTAWIGRVDFLQTLDAIGRPDNNPRAVERFLDGWWRNERVLDVFVVVFRVTFLIGSYRFFGPMIGIL